MVDTANMSLTMSSQSDKKKPIMVIGGLLLFLGIVATGAYFVSKTGNLADLRSQAANGDRWKIEKGCKGTGCVHDGRVVQAIRDDDIKGLKQAYIDIFNEGGFKEMVDVVKNPQNMALPYNPGGWSTKQLQYFYSLEGVDANGKLNGVLKENTIAEGRAGYGLITGGYIGADGNYVPIPNNSVSTVPGYYQSTENGNWYPVEVKEEKNEDKGGNTSSVATPTPAPRCTSINVYKDGVEVTPSTLIPENVVTIAVAGSDNPTQARFRVNGEQLTDTDADPNWTISTTKNTFGEYFVTYTIPTGVATFLFEAETFAQGAWH